MFIDFLVDDIEIVTANVLTNGFGGFKEYWNELEWLEADLEWNEAELSWDNSITVKGLIDLQTGTEKSIGDKYITDSTHILFLQSNVEISHTKRVVKNNEIYRVLYVDTPFLRQKEVYLQKVGVDNV